MPIAGLSKPPSRPNGEEPSAPPRTLAAPVTTFLKALDPSSAASGSADGPVIHVSSVVSGAAAFYERLRYTLDYHEEHLLRRHALERMLRRRFDDRDGVSGAARPLLVELVQAKYLKNDSLSEATVPAIQATLDRYAAAFSLLEHEPGTLKERAPLQRWVLGLCSAELDAGLVPAPEEAALVELMGAYAIRDNTLDGWPLDEEERQTQVFIACYRALFAFDPQTLHFLLLSKRWPSWRSATAADVPSVLPRLLRERLRTERALRHPVASKLFRSLKGRAIAFHVLKDIVREYPQETRNILLNEARLSTEISETCQRYYRGARRRLYRSAIRSTIYIFLTKVVLALAVEAPAEQYLFGAVASLPLVVNLVFPPGLMVLLTATTRLPNAENTTQVSRLLATILYGDPRRVFPKLKASAAVSTGLFPVFYLATFVLTFGLTIWALRQLGFTFIGVWFFLLFLSVVSFFALRIRQPVRDLFIAKHRENIVVVLIDFLSLPILSVGQWISLTSARLNIFLYLFDYFLEAPFKTFLSVFEEMLGSFREKREDLL